MNSIWWHIAETVRNNMEKDVSQNRLHHELQLPSLGDCRSALIHLPMFPTQIMRFCHFCVSVWKISRQLEARSRWKSLGTCHSHHQHEYVLGADWWWGEMMPKWWSSAGRQAAPLVTGTMLSGKETCSTSFALLRTSSRLNWFFFLRFKG